MPAQSGKRAGRYQQPSTPDHSHPGSIHRPHYADCTGEEIKLALYLYRRTNSFGKTSDRVCLRQICTGTQSKSGRVLDGGTGLDLKTAKKAADAVVAKGIFSRQRAKGPYGDTYSVRDVHFSAQCPQPDCTRTAASQIISRSIEGLSEPQKRWKDSNGSKVEALEKLPAEGLEKIQRLPLENSKHKRQIETQ